MRVLGLDLEGMNVDITKGVQTKTDRVTEIGAVLWQWETKTPLEMMSQLVAEPDCPTITEENTRITGITNEMVTEFGASPAESAEKLAALMNKADYIMAHNGGSQIRPTSGYDYQMLKAMYERYAMKMPETPWIDTLTDLEFPEEILIHTKGRRDMMSLEHAHGFINPFPHRAVTDVLAMMKIASNYDIERMVVMSRSPVVELIWSMPYPNFRAPQSEKDAFEAGKALAKKNAFRWNADAKEWVRETKLLVLQEGKLDEGLEGLQYNVRKSDGTIMSSHELRGIETTPDETPF